MSANGGLPVVKGDENLVTVAKLLGHERLETTAIYTQPWQQDLEKAVEKLATGG
jgi:site-specific recombinase XerD